MQSACCGSVGPRVGIYSNINKVNYASGTTEVLTIEDVALSDWMAVNREHSRRSLKWHWHWNCLAHTWPTLGGLNKVIIGCVIDLVDQFCASCCVLCIRRRFSSPPEQQEVPDMFITSLTSHGSRVAQILTPQSRSSILSASNTKCSESVLIYNMFRKQSASLTAKRVRWYERLSDKSAKWLLYFALKTNKQTKLRRVVNNACCCC